MKFSVLMPTRNRLEYLPIAVQSVLAQDYDDWEIIVYDNCSDQDVAGYVRSLNDTRVKYYRTEEFVAVTANWNNAIERSTGDFVVMIGDDDVLLRGYFSSISRVIREFPESEMLYTGALLYAFPGVVPGWPDGRLASHNWAEFLRSADRPFVLDHDRAVGLVRRTMNFQARVDYNAQFAVVSRRLVERIRAKGKFYQGPFPDYYAMCALLLEAQKILVYPVPVVAIGVTPKSHGYYVFNGLHNEAGGFLNSAVDPEIADRLKGVMLPGTHINTGWLITMETVAKNYGKQFGLRPSHFRYRLLQFLDLYTRTVDRKMPARDLQPLVRKLRPYEKAAYAFWTVCSSVLPVGRRRHLIYLVEAALKQFPVWQPVPLRIECRNLAEVAERVVPSLALQIQPA